MADWTREWAGTRMKTLGWLLLAAGINMAVSPCALARSPQKSTRLGHALYQDGQYEDAAAR
ncbi:MAG TPA: hypothetical protein PKU74_04730, partial [Candidatus Omnitrophota bacterium]|nr:hypothetical protein [Candidatus Omnitrophota bacterium]